MRLLIMDRSPFDPVRSSFLLVAGAFGFYGFMILLSALSCIQWADKCPPQGTIAEALSTLLASALAFAAGRMGSK